MLTLSALQSVGVLMLVPLLGFIGLSEDSGVAAGIGSRIGELFRILGLPETLPSVLGVFLVLVCLREGLLCSHTVRAATIQQSLTQCLQERLYRAITYSKCLFFTRTRPSDFTQALTGDIGRIGQGTLFVGTGLQWGHASPCLPLFDPPEPGNPHSYWVGGVTLKNT